MKNVKMSLANIQGKLSRKELKNIMAGSGDAVSCTRCSSSSDCFNASSSCGTKVACGPGTWCSKAVTV